MQIPEFDMMVLADISDCKDGWSREELVAKHGFEILKTLDFLLENQLIKEHKSNLAPFLPSDSDYIDPPLGNLVVTDAGRIEVKRWRTLQTLSNQDRWKERIFGFVSGVLVTVVGGLILLWLSR
mgnify:CR=1 FL=1